MRARPRRDRLAVCTFEEAGQEIPNGDPSVTDAERAAAGRETLAERFAAVLPGNRRRAAERYTADGLPDWQDAARVWRPRDPAELRTRLTEPPLVRRFAPTLESAIEAGAVPSVLLVGLHNALGALTSASDLRAQEYLPGHNRRRFDAHLRFVTSEVWWEQQLPVALGWLLQARGAQP